MLYRIDQFLTKTGKWILDITDPVFKPNFQYSFIVALLVMIAAFSFGSDFAAFKGYFMDPDNYVYVSQALDWIHGQSWFDTTQYRINPPFGTEIHYSRILSAIYGIDIFILSLFMSEANAVIIVAALYPLLFFYIFLLVMQRASHLLCGEFGNIVLFFVIFCPFIITRFAFGVLDHHGIVLILIISSFICISEMILNERTKSALLAGFFAAFALALGLESLAIVCLFSLCLGILSVIKGGIFARLGFLYSLALFVSSFVLLVITKSPDKLFVADPLSYSFLFVVLMFLKVLCFGAIAIPTINKTFIRRISIGSIVSIIAAGGFFYAFPSLTSGPYGAMNPDLAKIIFTNASEAWSLFIPYRSTFAVISFIIISLLMIFPSVFFAVKDTCEKRGILWSGLSIILISLFLLSCFYQIRLMMYFSAFSLFGIAAIIKKTWFDYKTLFFVLLVPLHFIVSDQVFPDLKKDPALNYSEDKKDIKCDHFALAKVLNRFDEPLTIINTMDAVSPVLFLTQHSVLAAPYHTNLEGNLNVHKFFTTEDEEAARKIAEKTNAKLVVVCSSFVGYYVYQKTAPKGTDLQNMFIQRLVDGKIPKWLTKIEDEDLDGYLVFKIK